MGHVVLGNVKGVHIVGIAAVVVRGCRQDELKVRSLGDGVFRLDAAAVKHGVTALFVCSIRGYSNVAGIDCDEISAGLVGVVIHVGQRAAHLVDAWQREEVAWLAIAHDAAPVARLSTNGVVLLVGVFGTEGVTYLMGNGCCIADGPCASFQRSGGGAAELCHAVTAFVRSTDQYAEVILGGVGPQCLVNDLSAQVQTCFVGCVMVEPAYR